MRLFLRAGASALLCSTCFAGPTLAADAQVTKPYSAPPIVRSWSGPYLGGGLTYGTADYQAQPAPGVPPLTQWDADGIGLAGVLGYNFQNGRFVYGLEGQLSWPNVSGSPANIGGAGPGRSELEWIAALRGRVGYLATNDLLVHVSGGFARARGELSAAGFAPPTTRHATHSGWTAGIGADLRVNETWSLGLRANYYDFDGRRYNSFGDLKHWEIMALLFTGGLDLFGVGEKAAERNAAREAAEKAESEARRRARQ
jgi:outer membrane immunogenic protein